MLGFVEIAYMYFVKNIFSFKAMSGLQGKTAQSSTPHRVSLR